MIRSASLLIVAGLWPGRSFAEIETKVAALSARDQVEIIGGVMLALFVAATIAAHFGWIGMALFWLGLIVIAR